MVHDLKNPLSAILGNLDLLEMRSDPRVRYIVQRCQYGAKRMLKMILNLLDVDGLEEGKLEPRVERVDGAALTEASGGINLESVRAVAETGVDLISVGALTHSAAALDVTLEFDWER